MAVSRVFCLQEAAERKVGEKLERERREKLAMMRDQTAEDLRGKKARVAKHLDSIAVVVGEKEPPPAPEPTTASAVSRIPLAHIPLPRWTRVVRASVHPRASVC